MLRVLVLGLFVSIASAQITFEDCSHHEIHTLKVTGCESSPCTLHKGKEISIDVEFVANQDSTHATMHITAHVGIIAVEIPGVDRDACNGHLTCPLKKGETYHLKYSMVVPESAPTISAHIQAKLSGDHGALACASVDGSIKQ